MVLVLIASGLVASARQQPPNQSPPGSVNPFDPVELLSSSGYEARRLGDGFWEVLDLKIRPKNLKSIDAVLARSSDNKNVRVRVFIGVCRSQADEDELKTKLVDLNRRSRPTELLLDKGRVFAVTDLAVEKIDKETLVSSIEKTAKDADDLYPEIAMHVRLLEPSMGAGMGPGAGKGGGIGRNPDKPGDSPTSSSTSSAVDSRPVALNSVRPEYTREARAEKVQGVVRLRILVDETGSVAKVSVITGLPAGLTDKAIEAVRKIRFKPAMKDGKPVNFWTAVVVNFELK
jgi:TonB family protein